MIGSHLRCCISSGQLCGQGIRKELEININNQELNYGNMQVAEINWCQIGHYNYYNKTLNQFNRIYAQIMKSTTQV